MNGSSYHRAALTRGSCARWRGHNYVTVTIYVGEQRRPGGGRVVGTSPPVAGLIPGVRPLFTGTWPGPGAGAPHPVARLRRALGGLAATAIALSPVATTTRATGWVGRGELAVVVHGRLALYSRTGVRRYVPGRGEVSQPRWSADGRWVAFLRPSPTPAEPGRQPQLWTARANGTDVRRVTPVGTPVGAWQWAPSGPDVLGYEVPARSGPGPVGYYTDLVAATMPASGTGAPAVRRLARLVDSGGLAWSPSGSELAVSYRPSVGARTMVAVTPATHWAPRALGGLTSGPGSCVQLQGWWPDGQGLIVWEDPYCSASIAADGLALASAGLDAAHPSVLATTLVHPEWVAWSPGGRSVAIVAGGNREVWYGGKHIELCRVPSGSCHALPVPSGRMALLPAWTTAGRLLYDLAPAAPAPSSQAPSTGAGTGGWQPGGPFSEASSAAWYSAMRLYEAGPDGKGPRYLAAAGPGAHDPLVTSHGLLFVRATGLWYLADGSRGPVEVASGLGDPSPFGNYYGYVEWSQDFAWHV